jgi:hypothetical protein
LARDLTGNHHRDDQQRQERTSRGFSNVHGLPPIHRLANLRTPYSQGRGESDGERLLSISQMENVIFGKRFVEALAQEVDRSEGRSICRDAITNIGAIVFFALPNAAA